MSKRLVVRDRKNLREMLYDIYTAWQPGMGNTRKGAIRERIEQLTNADFSKLTDHSHQETPEDNDAECTGHGDGVVRPTLGLTVTFPKEEPEPNT